MAHVVKDEKEKEKHLDARYGTKTGMMFFKKIKAQINLREYIFRHLNIYEVLIFRFSCLLNNLDFVGQSHSPRSTRKIHSKVTAPNLKSARLRGAQLRLLDSHEGLFQSRKTC